MFKLFFNREKEKIKWQDTIVKAFVEMINQSHQNKKKNLKIKW
jgi:hypothetical protein